jgi:hypothetical protein
LATLRGSITPKGFFPEGCDAVVTGCSSPPAVGAGTVRAGSVGCGWFAQANDRKPKIVNRDKIDSSGFICRLVVYILIA